MKWISFIIVVLASLNFILATTYLGSQRWYLEQKIRETTLAVDSKYNTIETPHFTIKYLPNTQGKAQMLATEAEEIYKPVTSIFHLQSPKKTIIVLESYPQEKITDGQLMAGYVNWGVIHVYDDPLNRVSFRSSVAHEFSHVMTRHKYNGAYKLPSWLDEGLAFNIETSITGAKQKNDDDNKRYTIENLAKLPSFGELPRVPNTLYHQSSGIISYIVETYGEGAFFQILDQINYEDKLFAKAIENILHLDVPTLDSNAHQYFRNKPDIKGSFEE